MISETDRPIVFIIHNLVLFETLRPLVDELISGKIGFDLFVPKIEEINWGEMSKDTYNYILDQGYHVQYIDKVPETIYKIAFYPYLPYYYEFNSSYKVRYQYGMAKPRWNLDTWSVKFDYILCNGLYDNAVLRSYSQTEIVGMLKYVNFSRENMKQKSSNKLKLLYLPTYGEEASIDTIEQELITLKEKFDITIKLHHGTTFLEPDRVQKAKNITTKVLDHKASLVELIAETDVVLSDGSGAIFDALYTNTPIVVFKQKATEPFEGILALEERVIQEGIVPCICSTESNSLEKVIKQALTDEVTIHKRTRFSNEMFPIKGRETLNRYMKLISNLLENEVDHAYLAGHRHLNHLIGNLEVSNKEINEKNQLLKVQKEELENRIELIKGNVLDLENKNQDLNLNILNLENKNHSFNLNILDLENENQGLNLEISEKNTEIYNLNVQKESLLYDLEQLSTDYEKVQCLLNEKEIEYDELLTRKNSIEHELNNIYNSKRWRVAERLRNVLYKTKLIYLHKAFNAWKQYGFKIMCKKIKVKLLNKQNQHTSHDVANSNTTMAVQSSTMLNWYEYKFKNYLLTKEKSYSLPLNNITVPFQKGMVSIVLPVYNGEDLLSEAIDSILNQTFRNFELIIINDGSTDQSADVIESYAKKDQRIIAVHQENCKIPRTLSRGFKMAQGEYYTWTSADNNMHPMFLEKMIHELERDDNIGMVYANMRLIDENGNLLRNHGWYEEPKGSSNVSLPKSTLELNVYPNNIIGAAFMYRAKVAKILGDYSLFKHTLEDYDYWMRVNSLFDLRHVEFDEPIYDYRWHDKSLTAQDKVLGITSSRYKLMVLDDFRRDFYLSPLVWIMEGEQEIIAEFKQYAEEKGHLVINREDLVDIPEINLATPFCYLSTCENDIDKLNLPISTYKVLLVDEITKTHSNTMWDMCIKFNETTDIINCSNTSNIFGVSTIEAMFALINTKMKNDHLYCIESEIEQEKEYKKKISVVLCTYKRSEKFANALKSVITQTMVKRDYEIIVVNNDFKNHEIKALVDEYRTEYEITEDGFLNYFVAPLKGLSFARNVGMFAAYGEVILYIDDDSIAEPDLLEQTYQSFDANPDFGVIGGNIILNKPESKLDIIRPGTEAFWSQLIVEGNELIQSNYQWEFPYGANFAVRHNALLRIGGFRTSYGRKGNNYAGGEEIVVSFMMKEIGLKVGLNPKSKVIHDVAIDRYTIEHLKKTIKSSMITNYQLQKDLYAPMESDINYDLSRLELLKEEIAHLKDQTNYEEIKYDILLKEFSVEGYEALIALKKEDLGKRELYVKS